MLTAPLREEGEALFGLVDQHGESIGTLVTQFKQWTGWDVIAHLHHSDQMALAAVRGGDAFNEVLNGVMGAMGQGKSLITHTKETLGDMPFPALVDAWKRCFTDMCDAFDATDPDVKLPWFGPPMKVRMFSTARQMETWAHGLALYDALGMERTDTDRLRDVVFIGVRTFSFCFANRQFPAATMPYLELTAPSGEVWTYGDKNEDEVIRGPAADFAMVVTQTRNIADVALEVRGPTAIQWMSVAQCFAGPPEDPPAPGTRYRVSPF